MITRRLIGEDTQAAKNAYSSEHLAYKIHRAAHLLS